MLSRYLLLHDTRSGLKIYKFQTHKDLGKLKLLGLTVEEDINSDMRSLLIFLGIAVEYQDYVIIMDDVPVAGEW
jgi:hypothetical protein